MRCLLNVKELPKKCPKCGKRLKSEKCTCGHTICQEPDNHEKKLFKGAYDYDVIFEFTNLIGSIFK